MVMLFIRYLLVALHYSSGVDQYGGEAACAYGSGSFLIGIVVLITDDGGLYITNRLVIGVRISRGNSLKLVSLVSLLQSLINVCTVQVWVRWRWRVWLLVGHVHKSRVQFAFEIL